MQIKKIQLSIKTILLAVSLLVLLIPFTGIYFFRLYENELVRQTESELLSQAAFISAIYKNKIPDNDYGRLISVRKTTEKYDTILPTIDLSKNKILPTRPDGIASAKPDSKALQAGRDVSPIIEEAISKTLSGIRITDFNGVVIAGSDEIGTSLARIYEVSEALKGNYKSVVRKRISQHMDQPLSSISRSTNIRVFIAYPIITNSRLIGVILLSRSPKSTLKSLYEERENLSAAIITLIILTLGISLVSSYAIVGPIRRLAGKVQATDSDDAYIPEGHSVISEVNILAQNINKMAETIRQRSAYIRNFATSVSHEFKTPLTSIRGAIELLGEHSDTISDEQKNRFYQNILHDTERLKNLTSRLMELARADTLKPSNAKTNPAEVISDVASRYGFLGLNIKTQLLEQNIKAYIEEGILETVMINLLDNSLQNGAKNLEIIIHKKNDKVEITVADDGAGISHENIAKLFQPFFTTNQHNGGTGLGLSVIKSLLNANGSKIEFIQSKPGATFKISLLAAAL